MNNKQIKTFDITKTTVGQNGKEQISYHIAISPDSDNTKAGCHSRIKVKPSKTALAEDDVIIYGNIKLSDNAAVYNDAKLEAERILNGKSEITINADNVFIFC